jgi:hypothetical protein
VVLKREKEEGQVESRKEKTKMEKESKSISPVHVLFFVSSIL